MPALKKARTAVATKSTKLAIVPKKRSRGPRIVSRGERARAAASEYGPLVGFLAVAAGAAFLGARFNPAPQHRETKLWYDSLEKSPLNPPPVVFGPVWGVLYAMIGVAGWRVYRAPRSRARTEALVWWAAQMSLNAAWSPLFFGGRMPKAAMTDLVAMGVTVGGFTNAARKVDRSAAALMLPYLGWVSFAGYLNAEVVRRNPGGAPRVMSGIPQGL